MYFPSKKDVWVYPIHWGCVIACLTPIFTGREYGALFFTIPLAILFTWGWFATGYKIHNEWLIIQNGPIKKKIPIKEIKKITPTKNPLASAALSIDRLEIIYGSDFGMALVSPKDQQAFISTAKRINPRIEVAQTMNQ